MDVHAAIKGRRSVRSYKDLEIENDKIEKMVLRCFEWVTV